MNLVGRTLGKYELEEWVGAGATADVYLSHHPRLGIEVAVKVLKPQPDLGDDDVDRFVREAKDLIRLKHGSIVRLHDIGRDDGFTFLVLEFLHGRVLRDELDAEGPLAIDRVADIVARAADALDYLHDHDRVHLDIKPSNIVLGVDDEVTITDFGLAQCLGGAQNEPTVVSGTAPYMSPEQARGERDLGRESDVYSLGAVAYEMIVGRPPHTGDTPEDVLSKVAADAPATPIRDVNSGVPIPVASVVMRALECRKGNRFGTAGDFAADLTLAARAVALDRTIEVPRADVTESTSSGVSDSLPQDKSDDDLVFEDDGRRRRITVGAVVLAVLAVVAWQVHRGAWPFGEEEGTDAASGEEAGSPTPTVAASPTATAAVPTSTSTASPTHTLTPPPRDGVPSLIRPGDGIAVGCSDLSLEWAAVSTPGGTASYEWQIEHARRGVVGQDLVTSTQVIIPVRCEDDTYSWRVRAIGSAGDAGDWSYGRRFTVQPGFRDTTPPPVPNLIAPTDGSVVGCTGLTLVWSAVADPSGIERYEWEVRHRLRGIVGTGEQHGTEAAVPVRCPDSGSELYEWTVHAIDGAGNAGALAPPHSFEVRRGASRDGS